MQDIKNRIEAILFTTGKFMDVEEIAQFCHIASVGRVKDALLALIEDYKKREGALEIFEENNKYKLNIKKAYNYLTTNLLNDSELDKPTQETLAIIAYRNPAIQSDVIKLRGNGAYDHIKKLKEIGFLVVEKYSRTRKLKLTQKFFDYFDIVDPTQLGERFKQIEEKVRSLKEESNEGLEAAKESEAEDSGQETSEEKKEEPAKEEQSKEKTKETSQEEETKEAVPETVKEEDQPAANTKEQLLEEDKEEKHEEST